MAVIHLTRAVSTTAETDATSVPPGRYEVEAAIADGNDVEIQFLSAIDGLTWIPSGVEFAESGSDEIIVPAGTQGLRAFFAGVATANGQLVLKAVRSVGG